MISVGTSGAEKAHASVMRSLPKQIRYATAVALTRTAKDAQAEVRRQLPERFTIRTGWVAKGIRIKSARKDDLESSVQVKDDFMALQETGGLRRSRSGDALAVPVGARPTPRSMTRPDKFPGRMLDKSRYFIAPLTSKSLTARSRDGKNVRRRIHSQQLTGADVGKMAVFRRRSKKRLPIDLMYIFAKQVDVKPRFGFMETVKAVVEARLGENFSEAVRDALASAR